MRLPQRADGPYEALARLSVFLLQGDETEKGGGRGREQREVLLPHIQIYPGAVFLNVQDLFMSVSISASCLRGAASTPRLLRSNRRQETELSMATKRLSRRLSGYLLK